MFGCSVQLKAYSPRFRALYRHDRLGGMSCESKTPAAVTVCGKGSLLIHLTVSPRFTVNVSGSNLAPSITTVWRSGVAATIAPALSNPHAQTSATASRCHHRCLDPRPSRCPDQAFISSSLAVAGIYLPSVAWISLACSRCPTKAGRTLTISAFSSAFLALGISVLSIASITCSW